MDKRKGKVQPPDTTMGHIVSESEGPLPEVDLHSENLLQDYVIADPVPLNQKATSVDVEQTLKRKRQQKIVIAVAAVVVLVLLGLGAWWFWQSQQDAVPETDEVENIEPAVDGGVVTLSFDDEDVVRAFKHVERVEYAEPFLDFYPMGEITRADLSREQLAILRGEENAVVLADGTSYIHHLYLAERDGNKISLYEAVVVAEPTACTEPGEDWCQKYRTFSGTPLEGIYDENHWWQHNDKMDHFRWTFLKNTEGTYTLQSIASVKHLATK